MELKETLLKRRSVRKFKSDPISKEIIEELLHAGMSGPSACNKRPWDFYVITNKEKIEELRHASMFARYKAPLIIVVCGSLTRALPMQLSSYWIQDCSAATENILLRAVDLGLATCWCGVHPQKRIEEKVKKILDLKEKQIPLNLIFVGYPNEEVDSRDQHEEKRIHYID